MAAVGRGSSLKAGLRTGAESRGARILSGEREKIEPLERSGHNDRMRPLLLAGLFLALVPRVFAIELSLGHFVGTNHPMHREVFLPLAERIALESHGALTLRIIPDLGNPPRQWDRVLAGEFDLVFGLPGYTPDRFPRTRLIELPGIAEGSAEGTRMLDNARTRTLAAELADVVPLSLWANEPSVLLCRGHRVRRPADLVGLRIRASDPTSARVLELWGATPVVLPVGQIFPAFASGDVDGVLIGASGITSFHLDTVADSCTFPLPVMLTSFYLAMNRASWNSLSSEAQGILRVATGRELGLAASAAYERAGAEGFEALRASGSALVSLSPVESESFLSPLGKVRTEVLGALADLGIEGQAVLDTFRPRLRTALDRQPPQLELHGATGLRYSLETSEDLKRWSPGGDQSGGPDGTATWILPLITSREVYFRVNVP